MTYYKIIINNTIFFKTIILLIELTVFSDTNVIYNPALYIGKMGNRVGVRFLELYKTYVPKWKFFAAMVFLMNCGCVRNEQNTVTNLTIDAEVW